MRRHVLGIIAATTAAPYITAALMIVRVAAADPPTLVEAFALLFWVGSVALLFCGIPILFASVIVSAFVRHLERYALPASVLSGALTGSGFMIFLSWNVLHSSAGKLDVGCGAIAGAVCGWIYWRITMGGAAHTR